MGAGIVVEKCDAGRRGDLWETGNQIFFHFTQLVTIKCGVYSVSSFKKFKVNDSVFIPETTEEVLLLMRRRFSLKNSFTGQNPDTFHRRIVHKDPLFIPGDKFAYERSVRLAMKQLFRDGHPLLLLREGEIVR